MNTISLNSAVQFLTRMRRADGSQHSKELASVVESLTPQEKLQLYDTGEVPERLTTREAKELQGRLQGGELQAAREKTTKLQVGLIDMTRKKQALETKMHHHETLLAGRHQDRIKTVRDRAITAINEEYLKLLEFLNRTLLQCKVGPKKVQEIREGVIPMVEGMRTAVALNII